MANKISAGDTVRLKSGGPTMTVNSVRPRHGKEYAHCSWFVDSEKHDGAFPLESLKQVEGQK